MYLVDTDVISALAPSKTQVPPGLARWLEERSTDLYLSSVSVVELVGGIAKLRRKGAVRKADLLANWVEVIFHVYSNRILPFDLPAAQATGLLFDLARGKGLSPGFADLAIAGTAVVRSLIVLTRNVRHFQPLGVQLIDPFDRLPP